jgi:hypothetical protein
MEWPGVRMDYVQDNLMLTHVLLTQKYEVHVEDRESGNCFIVNMRMQSCQENIIAFAFRPVPFNGFYRKLMRCHSASNMKQALSFVIQTCRSMGRRR